MIGETSTGTNGMRPVIGAVGLNGDGGLVNKGAGDRRGDKETVEPSGVRVGASAVSGEMEVSMLSVRDLGHRKELAEGLEASSMGRRGERRGSGGGVARFLYEVKVPAEEGGDSIACSLHAIHEPSLDGKLVYACEKVAVEDLERLVSGRDGNVSRGEADKDPQEEGGSEDRRSCSSA